MPDNQELHIGTVSKPRLSPETVYDVEYTQTLPSNPITIPKPHTMDEPTGQPYAAGPRGNCFVAVDGHQFSFGSFTFYRTDVKLVTGDIYESSRKVGASSRVIGYKETIHDPVPITIVDLTNIFPSAYANWDIIIGPNFAMHPSDWLSFLVYDYVIIDAIPDEATRVSLTKDDINWTEVEGGSWYAWIYVVETNTLYRAVDALYSLPTDPPGWGKHTEGIIIDFPQGVSRKRQCIARHHAFAASHKGNKVLIDYEAEIRDPDTGTTMTLTGTSGNYSVNNSPLGANLVLLYPVCEMFSTNGDMHGTITMTETPI